MKRLALLLIVLLMPSVYAQIFTATPLCDNDYCIRGTTINWSLNITNLGDAQIQIKRLYLYENETGARLGEYNATKIYIGRDKSELVNVQGTLPITHRGKELALSACFEIATNIRERLSASGIFFGTEYLSCPPHAVIMEINECGPNNLCPGNQFCGMGICASLECGVCQYIYNNTCVSHECCSSTSCNLNEKCTSNKCEPLNCRQDAQLFNHTCISLNCELSEYGLNHECVPLTCDKNEYAADHQCLSLNCTSSQRAVDHECVPFICADDEISVNNTCQLLNCSISQRVQDHQCVDLSCWHFQRPLAHKCFNDPQLLRIQLLEIISVLSIAGVALLIWHRHRKVVQK